MSQSTPTNSAPLIAETVDIVSTYVANNHVARQDLPSLIASVHRTLLELVAGSFVPSAEERPEHPTPAQIRKSITPDALISFVDGKPYKTLKRHLRKHGFDENSYRQQFGLPADYPMTSARYSARRSTLAKNFGLGRGQQAPVDADAPEETPQAAE